MSQILLAAAAVFSLSAEETERDAVLLECCDLPDKKLILSEADLDGIVSRFSPNTPVKIEHQDTVFDPLGTVQRVWRDGQQLLGRLAFTPEMAGFLRAKGVVKLSCGLKRMSDDLRTVTLSEVSLVLKPRIASACLLSEDDAAELLRLRADNVRILAESRARDVDTQVVALKLAGKIVPATEAAARVLLSASDAATVTLADGNSLAVAEAFTAYLAAQPPLITLGQLTTLASAMDQQSIHATDEVILTPDQREFYEKSLGVSADAVQKTMNSDKKKAASGTGSRMHEPGSFPSMTGVGKKMAQDPR